MIAIITGVALVAVIMGAPPAPLLGAWTALVLLAIIFDSIYGGYA